MKLTNEQLHQFDRHLVEKEITHCPICGADDFLASTDIITLPAFSLQQDVQEPVQARKAAALRCKNCGHIMLFDLGDLGIA